MGLVEQLLQPRLQSAAPRRRQARQARRCAACQAELPSASALVSHLIRQHFRGSSFPCIVHACEQKMQSVRQFRDHLRKHIQLRNQDTVNNNDQEAVNNKKQRAFNSKHQNTVNKKNQGAFNSKHQNTVNKKKHVAFNTKQQDILKNRKHQVAFNNKHQNTVNKKNQVAINSKQQDILKNRKHQDAVNIKNHGAFNRKHQNTVNRKKQVAINNKHQDTLKTRKLQDAVNNQDKHAVDDTNQHEGSCTRDFSSPVHARRISCHICGAVFPLSQGLYEHERASHGFERAFRCELCESAFLNVSALGAHVRNTHNHQRPFRCDKCPFSSSRSSHLRQHACPGAAGRELHACHNCDVTYWSARSLAAHRRACLAGEPEQPQLPRGDPAPETAPRKNVVALLASIATVAETASLFVTPPTRCSPVAETASPYVTPPARCSPVAEAASPFVTPPARCSPVAETASPFATPPAGSEPAPTTDFRWRCAECGENKFDTHRSLQNHLMAHLNTWRLAEVPPACSSSLQRAPAPRLASWAANEDLGRGLADQGPSRG